MTAMAARTIDITVPEENNLERIDRFLTASLEDDFSRSFIQKLIKGGMINVNGATIRQNYKVKTDDVISIEIPEPEKLDIEPRDIPLSIVYQDENIAVIDKQPGLVVHPGPGNRDATLVSALLFHLKGLSSIGGVERPGIVHRLDRDTSGLIVIARNDRAHRKLIEEFSMRRVVKHYSSVVVGKPAESAGTIDIPIARHRKYRHKMTTDPDGREAITEYRINKIWNTGSGVFTLLDLNIKTGRTHQIRVHLSSMGNPVVGDPIYSKKWEKHKVPFLLLASVYLEFTHPVSGERL